MGKFTGSECIICQKRFTEDDDIVVCPDCGTPYHRECWAAKGKCINTSLHAVGGSWSAVQQENLLRHGGKVCPHCQQVNPPDARKCNSCGGDLETEEYAGERVRIPLPNSAGMFFEPQDPCCGLSPDEKMEEERLGDVANFVKKNTLYYVPLFRRFRDTGHKLSLNLTCALFPHLYFAYRKMWPMAIISCIIMIVCSLPNVMLGMLQTLNTPEFMQSLSEMYGVDATAMFTGLTGFLKANEALLENLNVPMYLIGIAIRMLFCLFGNHMYYRFVLKRVGRIRQTAPNAHVRKALLDAEGGTNRWNVLGGIGIYYGLVCGLYMLLMIVFM